MSDNPKDQTTDNNSFGEILHKVMKYRNFTNRDLANACGISEVIISQYLAGVKEPRYSQLIAIARALDMPITSFIPEDLKEDIFDICPNCGHKQLSVPNLESGGSAVPIYYDKDSNIFLYALRIVEDMDNFDLKILGNVEKLSFAIFLTKGQATYIKKSGDPKKNSDNIITLTSGSFAVITNIHNYLGSYKEGTEMFVLVYGTQPIVRFVKNFQDIMQTASKEVEHFRNADNNKFRKKLG